MKNREISPYMIIPAYIIIIFGETSTMHDYSTLHGYLEPQSTRKNLSSPLNHFPSFKILRIISHIIDVMVSFLTTLMLH